MKAVVLEEQGVINVREVPDVPAPGLGELKIAPHTVGVCGSDLHYYTPVSYTHLTLPTN